MGQGERITLVVNTRLPNAVGRPLPSHKQVVAPATSVVQAADQVDSAPVLLHPSETLLKVDRLILDSTSARQLAGHDNPGAAVAAIVKRRGKMHNPATNSGGVLLGTVLVLGPGSPLRQQLKEGDRVVPLASLTCIPLRLEAVRAFHGEAVAVDGTAVLFGSSPVAVVPPDISDAVAVLSLDISSLVPQVLRAVTEAEAVRPVRTVYVQGLGKSGLAAMATIRRADAAAAASCPPGRDGHPPRARTRILASDASAAAAEAAVAQHYADAVVTLDSRDPLATLEFLEQNGASGGADLVLACHNATDCEGAAVMATAPGGTAIFFSMATSFGAANLATDIAGKDVRCLFGVGLAEHQDRAMFQLLREDRVLRQHFEALAEALTQALRHTGSATAAKL